MNSKILFDEDGWLRLNAEVPKVSSSTSRVEVEAEAERNAMSCAFNLVMQEC